MSQKPAQTRQEAAQCKESWWLGLTERAPFYDRCRAEQARMQQSVYQNTTFGRGIEGSGA